MSLDHRGFANVEVTVSGFFVKDPDRDLEKAPFFVERDPKGVVPLLNKSGTVSFFFLWMA